MQVPRRVTGVHVSPEIVMWIVGADLERTLLRALAKDPDRRHRDAAGMAADLAACGTPRRAPAVAPDGDTARTRELPEGGSTLHLPGPRPSPDDARPGGGPLDRVVDDAEDTEGRASDRRRTVGTALLGPVVALVVLG